MTEQEKNKIIDELMEEWKKEISNISDINNQPKKGARLDNGDGGEYTRITEKYRKLINEIKNK